MPPRDQSFSIDSFAPANPRHAVSNIPLIDPIALQGVAVPERSWIVRDWIPNYQVTMLNGDGGIGKSLLAQQLLTSCATGNSWLGLDVKPCKALAFFCEDDRDEIHRRQVRINESMGLEFGDLENMTWAPMVGEDNILASLDRETWTLRETEIFRSIIKTAMDFGAELVVLDSLHDLFAGNENDRGQARQFIGFLRQLALAIEGAVVLTAHPSLGGLREGTGASGSTAWNNAVRSRLYLHRPKEQDGEEPDDDARILSRMKANYAGLGDDIKLEWRDGVFAPLYAPTGSLAAMERRNCETVFLEILARMETESRPVSDNSRAGNYAPKAFARRPKTERQGFSYREFARAMESLFSSERITLQDYMDASRHPRKKIVAAAQEDPR